MFSRSSRNFAWTLLATSAILAGCSDAPGPTAPGSELKPNFALNNVTDLPQAPVFGKILVCKSDASNISGTFTIVRNSGTGDFSSSATVAVGTCVEVANDGSTVGGSNFGITENAAVDPVNTTQALVACSRDDIDDQTGLPIGPTDCMGTVDVANMFLNSFHSFVLTYQNVFTPPPPPPSGCTYTKGWYQNKNGSPTVVGYDSRSKEDAQAIFNATPGRPGTVTWEGKNLLLNLYQQFLAALENLDGDLTGGPEAVDDAIAAVAAGTGGAGTAITTTLTQTEMSDLTSVLSAFNEGTYPGWPHCDG